MGTGTVLHVNVIGLMAALEENLDPALRGRPFVVANRAAPRAVVLDLSREAHREGVLRGMLLSRAVAMLSGLIVREPRTDICSLANGELDRICRSYSPQVEMAGNGHIFADLAGTSGLNGPPEDVSQRIRADIYSVTGLRPVLALAGSKTVSKVATRVLRPVGFIALSPWEENQLMRHQPVEFLPGVGSALSRRLDLLGIGEIGDLAGLSDAEARALGPRGPELAARARGMDAVPVDPEPPERRTERGAFVFEPDVTDPELLNPRVDMLASELAYSIRRKGMGARNIRVEVSYADGLRSVASARSPRVLVRDDEVIHGVRDALRRARTRRVRVRRISIELSGLGSAGPELDLFEPEETRLARLQPALDRVRTRYGFSAVSPAIILAAGRTGTNGGAVDRSFVPISSLVRRQGVPGEAGDDLHGLAVG